MLFNIYVNDLYSIQQDKNEIVIWDELKDQAKDELLTDIEHRENNIYQLLMQFLMYTYFQEEYKMNNLVIIIDPQLKLGLHIVNLMRKL